uniref:ATP synthase F0 subunit 8 n=1 Tax=Psyllaephagus populi TaxID=3122998 RepID=A0AAU7BNH4_9HYME
MSPLMWIFLYIYFFFLLLLMIFLLYYTCYFYSNPLISNDQVKMKFLFFSNLWS